MKSPTIHTDLCVLRPFKKEDASLWQTWDTDLETQAHMPEPKNEPQPIDEQYEYIKECEEDEEGWYWSIETKEGKTVGTVSLFDFNPHHRIAQIGIALGDKHSQGKGIATDVARSLVAYAFENLGISYISAEVEEANIPMQKVFEKIGFEKDGLFKGARVKDSQRINVLHYSIRK